jgi:hypothetical protein
MKNEGEVLFSMGSIWKIIKVNEIPGKNAL